VLITFLWRAQKCSGYDSDVHALAQNVFKKSVLEVDKMDSQNLKTISQLMGIKLGRTPRGKIFPREKKSMSHCDVFFQRMEPMWLS